MLRCFAFVLLLTATPIQAADNPQEAPVPEPPPMPEGLEEELGVEPDITIKREEDRVIEEYRINGQLYKVKITPKVGKPYYLLYPQGPDAPPVRRELGDLQTPHWIIFSW